MYILGGKTTMTEREKLEQEIRNLIADLSSPASRIGDWAVTKCLEYEKLGKDAPYDLTELMNQRQQVRDRINEIQTQLDTMTDEELEALKTE